MPGPTSAHARRRLLRAVVAFLAVLTVTPSLAAGTVEAGSGSEAPGAVTVTGSGPVTTAIVVEVLETGQGPDGRVEKRFVEARRLKAGEEVYYTIRVTNPGKTPVEDVVVTKRLPFGVDYIRGSAAGPACDVEFSTDGGNAFEARPKSGEYTHVRWTFGHPLAPGATALLRFRAIFR